MGPGAGLPGKRQVADAYPDRVGDRVADSTGTGLAHWVARRVTCYLMGQVTACLVASQL